MVVTAADKALANHYAGEYAKQVWCLVASFLFLVGVTNYGSAVLGKLFPGKKGPADVEADGRVVRHTASIRRLPLTIANTYRVLAFRTNLTIGSFTLNLAEVALTIAYIVALFVWTFINTTSLDGTKFQSVYYANRAANIACGQLPLVVALGTKNNIVGLITGLSHEKVNYMHRMTARVVFVLLWIHGTIRLISLKPGSLNEELIQSGILAISAFSFLIIVSLRPIRKGAYELFFFLHFSMVLLFLVGGYFHTKEPRVSYWFWVSFLIWGLDRLARFIRLVVFNHSYFGLKAGSGTMDASVELLSPDLVRLRLRRPPHFHWSPGQAAYLIMPGVSTWPFEAHPFTIASVDTTRGETQDDVTKTEKDLLGETEPYWKELVFFINVHSGFTKRLSEAAKYGQKVKAFVDGPYGKSPDLTGYDTSLLIAGGSGISFMLPVFLDSIKNVAAGKSNTKRITLIWSLRDPSHILWISETLEAATKLAPLGLTISVQIYLTGVTAFREWDDVSVKSGKGYDETTDRSYCPSLSEDPVVQVTTGSRPNLKHLSQVEADLTDGRMGVVVCGSQSVAAAVKDALGFSIAGPSSIMKGGPSITLHTEKFGYA